MPDRHKVDELLDPAHKRWLEVSETAHAAADPGPRVGDVGHVV